MGSPHGPYAVLVSGKETHLGGNPSMGGQFQGAGVETGLFLKTPRQMGRDQNPGNATTAPRTLDDKV